MKKSIREQIQREFNDLDAAAVRVHTAATMARLTGIEAFVAAQCLCVYISAWHEIETHGLIRQLLAQGRNICAPAFRAGYVIEMIRDFDQDLVAGKLGILEPRPGLPTCHPDAWLVPGLGFDYQGNRLGRGKGCYDRLLRETKGMKIALAHDFQLRPHIPTEAHDIQMDYIVTEKRVLHCRK